MRRITEQDINKWIHHMIVEVGSYYSSKDYRLALMSCGHLICVPLDHKSNAHPCGECQYKKERKELEELCRR